MFQKHYQAMATAHLQELRAKGLEAVEMNFVEMTGRHLQDTMLQHVNASMKEGITPDELTTDLSNIVNGAKAPEKVKLAAMRNTITQYAMHTQDLSVFKMADDITYKDANGQERKLGDDVEYLEAETKARDAINRTRYQAVRLDNAEQVHKQNALRNDVANELSAAMAANPGKPIDLGAWKKKYEDAGMGGKVEEVDQLYHALQQPPADDTQAFANLSARIHDPHLKQTDIGYVSTTTLAHALRTGQLKMADYVKLQAYVDKRDGKYDARGGRSQADPDARNTTFNNQKEQLAKLFSMERIKGLAVHGDIQDLENAAQSEFIDAYHAYMTKNKDDVDPIDLTNFLKAKVEELNTYYFSEGAPAGKASVTSPEGVGKTVKLNQAHSKERTPGLSITDENDFGDLGGTVGPNLNDKGK